MAKVMMKKTSIFSYVNCLQNYLNKPIRPVQFFTEFENFGGAPCCVGTASQSDDSEVEMK